MAGSSYHIYIHSVGGGESSSPTKPRKSTKPTQTKQSKEESGSDLSGTIRKVGSFITNPDSLIGTAKSVAIAKAGVVGAIGVVAYQIGMKVASEVVDLQALITGDISGQRALNNFRAITNIAFNPIASVISYAKYNVEVQQQNERARLQSQLLGDSVINQNYNRKV